MIGEREQVKSKAGAGFSFAPMLQPTTPKQAADVDFNAPSLTPRIAHRFQEMAVVPDTTENLRALPSDRDNAPQEGDTSKGKQAAPAPKQKVQAIEFDVTLSLLTFTLQDGSTIQTKSTFNGEPEYGDYVLAVQDGKIPDTAIIPCKRTSDGQALKWTYPEGATLEGVDFIEFHVVGIDQPTSLPAPLPPSKDDEKKGVGTGDTGKEKKGDAKKGQGEGGETGVKGKKAGVKSEVTGTDPKGKPTTQPATAPTTQPSITPATQPASAPTAQPTTQTAVTPYDDLIKSLSPELQDFLTERGGTKPTDLTKFIQVIQELQTLSPQEFEWFKQAATARTDDLDLFLKTIEWFKALSPEEKQFAAMDQDDKLLAAKKMAVEASGAALKDALSHPLQTIAKTVTGAVGFGGESFEKAKEDFEKAKHSSGKGKRGFFMGGVSKTLMGMSQATFTLGLIVGGAALLVSGPFVLVGSLAVAGVLGTAALFAQVDSAMSHLDAAAEAKTLDTFKAHSEAASEEFASLALTPIGILILSGILWSLKAGLKAVLPKKVGGAPKTTTPIAEKAPAVEEPIAQNPGETAVTNAESTLPENVGQTIVEGAENAAPRVAQETGAVPAESPAPRAAQEAGTLSNEPPAPQAPAAVAMAESPFATAKALTTSAEVDAALAAKKPILPELEGVPPEINKIFQKQKAATPAEKAQVKAYVDKNMEEMAETGKSLIDDDTLLALLRFSAETETAFTQFSSAAEVSKAVTKELANDTIRDKPQTIEQAETPKPGVNRTIKGSEIIQALESEPGNPANKSVLRVIREIFKTLENPAAYGDTLAEIWENAKVIQETQTQRIEQTGHSAFTLAMVDMLTDRGINIEIATNGIGDVFTERILKPGTGLLDLAFAGADHSITPHLLQFLMLDDMLQGLKPRATMKQLLMDLSQVTGSPGLGGDIWDLLLDAGNATFRRPEYLMPKLKALLLGLE